MIKPIQATSDGDAYASNESEDIWTAGIDLPFRPESIYARSMDKTWHSRIECHGESKEDAEELRDVVLGLLTQQAPATPSPDVEAARILELLKAGQWINKPERNAAYDAGIAALRQQPVQAAPLVWRNPAPHAAAPMTPTTFAVQAAPIEDRSHEIEFDDGLDGPVQALSRPSEAVIELLSHLNHLMDVGKLQESDIPVAMWNAVSCPVQAAPVLFAQLDDDKHPVDADLPKYTLEGLILAGPVAANPNQGAVPRYLRSLVAQMLPHLETLRDQQQAAPGACQDCKPGRGAGGPMIPYTCPKCQAAPGVVGEVIEGFSDALGNTAHAARWRGTPPAIGTKLYAAPHATPIDEATIEALRGAHKFIAGRYSEHDGWAVAIDKAIAALEAAGRR